MLYRSSPLPCPVPFAPPPRAQFFREEGCKMVSMTCEEHDQMAASTQFITHTVGRVLGAMDLQETPINTKVGGGLGGHGPARNTHTHKGRGNVCSAWAGWY